MLAPSEWTMEQEVAERLRVGDLMEANPNMVFVFGSNEAGIHGAGAARTAVRLYGAKMRRGVGHVGRTYAIPTKDEDIEKLPLDRVAAYVETFLDYAGSHPHLEFAVTRIGCGLAGFSDAEIGPLFQFAPANVHTPPHWPRQEIR